MKTLEEQLATANLKSAGRCERLTSYGDDMLQVSALLQDMTPAEANILGESMLLVRAAPGQVLIREGDTGEWMMLLLKGTVDITKIVESRGGSKAAAAAAALDEKNQPQLVNNSDNDSDSDNDNGKGNGSGNDKEAGQTSDREQNPAAAKKQLETDDTPYSRIAVIRRGAAIGEMSMLDSEPRYSSCTAIDEVEVGVLGRREIGLLIRDHPAVGAKLLVKITQLMAQRLRNTSNQLVKLMLQKAS